MRWRSRRLILGALLLVALAAVATAAVVQLDRRVPGARVSLVLARSERVPGRFVPLPWPQDASAAIWVEGLTELGGVRRRQVRPLASVTKLLSALVLLREHPLAPGQSGPLISFSSLDARAYRSDLKAGQSVLKVSAGEQLTELQALEAMLIPSADNVARVLARWSAGTEARFVQAMNVEAERLGLRNTHLAGPSGLNPQSVGTASDMLRLGAAVLANPVLRRIVAMPSVTLPVAGTVANYDSVLGRDGIVGIKTGSMSAAGGNFVFAAEHRVGGRTVTIIGAVLGTSGADALQRALDDATALVAAAAADVREVTVLPPGRTVLRVTSGWAKPVSVRTTRAAVFLAVPGQRLTMRVRVAAVLHGARVHRLAAGERLATVRLSYHGRAIELRARAATRLPPPSLLYRLTRS